MAGARVDSSLEPAASFAERAVDGVDVEEILGDTSGVVERFVRERDAQVAAAVEAAAGDREAVAKLVSALREGRKG